MKKMLLAMSLVVLIPPSFAEENAPPLIKLSTAHIENLGITEGKLTPITHIPVLNAPAKVLIPNNNDYVISAPHMGIIQKLNAAIGDSVKKGEVLAHIDSPNLLTLQSNYLKAQSALNLASAAYQRDKSLAQEGIIATRRVQETQSQFNAAQINMKEAGQLLELAGGNAARATEKLDSHLTVRSPLAGVVIERMAVVGARVDTLTPLYRVADLHTLWLDIAVPQERVNALNVGDPVSVEGTPITAQISLIGQSVNVDDQTILVRAVVNQEHGDIRVGQKVTVHIDKVSKDVLFRVPNTAIAQNDDKAFIFVRHDSGFIVTPITLISKEDEETIIQGNLRGTETIALKGAAVLKANWLGVGSAEQ